MMASDEPTDNAQHRKLMIKALENVRVVVRGSQFDAGALRIAGSRRNRCSSAVNPVQAFNNTDRYGQLPTLWHFRHVSCSRSIVEGYRLGVMSALRDPEEAMRHVKALTRAAGDRVRSVVETAVDYALEELDISHVAAMQMSADIGNGGHTPIVDCLYDAFQVLAIVSGTSGEMLASRSAAKTLVINLLALWLLLLFTC